MLDKCANSACSTTFRRLSDGKLFVIWTEADHHSSVSGSGHEYQYLWLCNSCCRTMTVSMERGKRPQVVPLPESATAARAEP